MNALVLQGSPRKNGNTATLAKKFIQGFASENPSTVVAEYWLNDLDIHPCQGCFQCRKNNSCVQNDDMQKIYPAIEAAHIIVFAVPVYWWHMNAQTKLCLDRLTALLSPDDKLPAMADKQIVLAISYNDRSCAECTIKMFEDFQSWIGVKLDVLEHCAKEGHVLSMPSKLELAYELGKNTQIKMSPSLPAE